jgi:hypothetical protein
MEYETHEEFRKRASNEFGIDLPHPSVVSARGEYSKETLGSQALFHIHMAATTEGPPFTKQRAVRIALFGVPIWMILVRFFLKRLAIWAWRELKT